MLAALLIVAAGLSLPSDSSFLRRYKYLWLTGILAVTGLTGFLGVNPLGYGPQMWLGCCGIYTQPSEPLKLLLIAYLAGYLADQYSLLSFPSSTKFSEMLPQMTPILVMTGLAVALLIIQRDLGTASLFFLLFASMVFVASGRKRLLAFSLILSGLAGFAGYLFFDLVKLRVDAWLNPWMDPSGGSYQIVQSLMAIANGGIIGRGPGLGSPGLVPLAHSDLIFSALAEEFGLIGVIALLFVIGVLAYRGLRAGMLAEDVYRGYLAAGLTTYLVGQSLLIIAGSLRILPLTGITLPFVAYGGSSLITSFIALLLLLHISSSVKEADQPNGQPVILPVNVNRLKPFSWLGFFLFFGIAVSAVVTGWWSIVRAPALLTRTDNPRRAIADRWVLRGDIYDRNLQLINASSGLPGNFTRKTYYPYLSNIVGYTDPTYGQTGLEASMDGYLRGLEGRSSFDTWWSHLIYGQPPPGVDIRLSLDLKIQRIVDRQLADHRGAAVLMEAGSGEILAMSSFPTFNANQLSDIWSSLISDKNSPLLNRAVQGSYPVLGLEKRIIPKGFQASGLDKQPEIGFTLENHDRLGSGYSPFQIAWIASVISNGGLQPLPKLVTGYAVTQGDWQMFSGQDSASQILTADEVDRIVFFYDVFEDAYWELIQKEEINAESNVTWYVGGTIPGWEGKPLVLAVLLEETNQDEARAIGRAILNSVIP